MTPFVFLAAGGQAESRGAAVTGQRLDPQPAHRVAQPGAADGRDRHGRHAGGIAGEEQDLGVGVALELGGEDTVDPKSGDHDPVSSPARGVGHRNPDRLEQLVPLGGGLDPQSLGRSPLERPADQGAAGEIFIEGVALGGPGLEHAGGVDDEHPIGSRLAPQLVGLVEQVGAVVGAERLADPGDVRRHLHQRGGELAQASAPAHQCVADGGARRPERPRRGDLGGGFGAATGDQQCGAQRRHHHQGGAGENLSTQGHPQYLRPCCGYGWPNLLRCGLKR